MIKCFLCDNESEEMPKLDDYYHIKCKKCGEYIISSLSLNQISPDNKYLLMGKVFETNYSQKSVLKITSDLIESINTTGVNISFKVYKLVEYLYQETLKKGLGAVFTSVPLACCYAKNNDEFYELLCLLKEKNVVTFFCAENGNFGRIFGKIKLHASTFSKFQLGINSLQDFEEKIMGKDTDSGKIVLTNYGNFSLGNNNILTNNTSNGITESEIITAIMRNGVGIDVIDRLRDEIKELTLLYNKQSIDKSTFQKVLERIKKIGGNAVLFGLNVLSRPEIIPIIENIIKNK